MNNKCAKYNIIQFIKNNGWKEYDNEDDDSNSFIKDNNIAIDVDDQWIVLIDEMGDFCHIEIDGNAIYTLLGRLIQNRCIGMDYKWMK